MMSTGGFDERDGSPCTTQLNNQISEVLAFVVFDPFVELTITLCIIVNVLFMCFDRYAGFSSSAIGFGPRFDGDHEHVQASKFKIMVEFKIIAA